MQTRANTTPRASARSEIPTFSGHPPATVAIGPSLRTTKASQISETKLTPRPAAARRPTHRRRPSRRASTPASTHEMPTGRTGKTWLVDEPVTAPPNLLAPPPLLLAPRPAPPLAPLRPRD